MYRLAATATALLVAGCVVTSDGNAFLASAESTPAGAHVTASLDGTYRVEILGSQGRFNGEPYLNEDTERWYAINSSCTSAGCTARARQLDNGSHSSAPPNGRVFALRLERGHWVTEAIVDASPCLADPARNVPLAVRWELQPRADGTLTGTRTLTEVTGGSGPCAGSGGVYETPVLLTPVPDAPH